MVFLQSLSEANVGVFHADGAAADAVAQLASFEGFTDGPLKLEVVFDGGQPETELVRKVMAGSTSTVALNEWSGSEVFQAGTGAGE